MHARIRSSLIGKLVTPRRTERGNIILQHVRGVTLPKQQSLQLRPSLLVSPMFAQHVSGIDKLGQACLATSLKLVMDKVSG